MHFFLIILHKKQVMEDKNKQIAAKIKALRTAKNIGQNVLAQRLNISVTAYNRVENNKTQITVTMLFDIARGLDVLVGDILELGAYSVAHNKDNVVMTNFNYGNLHVHMTPEDLKKHFEKKND